MFNSVTAKGADTRARILTAALALFREKGFEATTMRDVAAATGMSLGAAYHYFPSKDAIVLAYYVEIGREHQRRVEEALADVGSLEERLAIPFHVKLDLLAPDRPLVGALLRFTGQPSHPLSFLGAATRGVQLHSMAIFAASLRGTRLPADMQALAPVALWALHMGILLYFLYDGSPGQQRTRRLVDASVGFFAWALKALKLPGVRMIPRKAVAVLTEAGLVPSAADVAAAAAGPLITPSPSPSPAPEVPA